MGGLFLSGDRAMSILEWISVGFLIAIMVAVRFAWLYLMRGHYADDLIDRADLLSKLPPGGLEQAAQRAREILASGQKLSRRERAMLKQIADVPEWNGVPDTGGPIILSTEIAKLWRRIRPSRT
jgi:hypothetical protein